MKSVPGEAYLHPAQEEEEQLPQPELPPEPSEDFPMPNFESRLVVSREPQLGQTTSGFAPKTSFSKQQLHLLH